MFGMRTKKSTAHYPVINDWFSNYYSRRNSIKFKWQKQTWWTKPSDWTLAKRIEVSFHKNFQILLGLTITSKLHQHPNPCQQHQGGLPSKHYPVLMLLNFSAQMGACVSNMAQPISVFVFSAATQPSDAITKKTFHARKRKENINQCCRQKINRREKKVLVLLCSERFRCRKILFELVIDWLKLKFFASYKIW